MRPLKLLGYGIIICMLFVVASCKQPNDVPEEGREPGLAMDAAALRLSPGHSIEAPVALHPGEYSLKWTVFVGPAPSLCPAFPGDGTLIIGTAGRVHRLRLADGSKVWEESVHAYLGETNVYLAGSGFYVIGLTPLPSSPSGQVLPDPTGAVVQFRNVSDGHLRWERKISERILYAQSVYRHDQDLYIATEKGNCYRLDPDNAMDVVFRTSDALGCVLGGDDNVVAVSADRKRSWFFKANVSAVPKVVSAAVLGYLGDSWLGLARDRLVRIDREFKVHATARAPKGVVDKGGRKLSLPYYLATPKKLFYPLGQADAGNPMGAVGWCSTVGGETGQFGHATVGRLTKTGERLLMSHPDRTVELVDIETGAVQASVSVAFLPQSPPFVVSESQFVLVAEEGVVSMYGK